MKLYDAAWAPSPRRVRIFLAEKKLQLERVDVDLRHNAQLQAPYLAINPRGTVPALQLDDGTVIDESVAICRYLEALHPAPPLFGSSPLQIAQVEGWTRRIESDGYMAVVYAFRNSASAFEGRGVTGRWPPIPQLPELAARGRIMWDTFIRALDARLAQSLWVAGDDYSFADITALITVDFAASAAKLAVPEDCLHVERWRAAATARPSAAA